MPIGIGQGAGMGAAAGSVIPGIGTAIGAGIGAIAGGLSSMFSAKSQSDQMNENIRRAKAMLAEGLVSSEEIQNRLHAIDRQFNARLTSVLNTTAIRSRGIANKGVVGAAVAGSVEGARLATEAGVIEQSLQANRGIRTAQAQLELSKSNPDMIGSFVEGAAAGVTTGMEAARMIGGPGDIPDIGVGDTTGQSQVAGFGSIPRMENADQFNPFIRKSQDRLGNVEDPLRRMPTESPFSGNVSMGVWNG